MVGSVFPFPLNWQNSLSSAKWPPIQPLHHKLTRWLNQCRVLNKLSLTSFVTQAVSQSVTHSVIQSFSYSARLGATCKCFVNMTYTIGCQYFCTNARPHADISINWEFPVRKSNCNSIGNRRSTLWKSFKHKLMKGIGKEFTKWIFLLRNILHYVIIT